MAPLCTAKIEEDCSARAMLWTPTMNIHQPTLHLFDQLSVCVCEHVCACVWVLEFYSLTGCSLWNQSSQGFISFFSRSELSFFYRRWTACTHAPTVINPYPPRVLYPPTSETHYSTKQGNAVINPLWFSLLHYCPNASSPVCDVISCAVEKVKYVGCFACCADFEVALISPFRIIITCRF